MGRATPVGRGGDLSLRALREASARGRCIRVHEREGAAPVAAVVHAGRAVDPPSDPNGVGIDFATLITTFGKLHLNPETRHEALEEYQHLVEECRKEPGCGNYVVSADLVDPLTLYI